MQRSGVYKIRSTGQTCNLAIGNLAILPITPEGSFERNLSETKENLHSKTDTSASPLNKRRRKTSQSENHTQEKSFVFFYFMHGSLNAANQPQLAQLKIRAHYLDQHYKSRSRLTVCPNSAFKESIEARNHTNT